jgi:hypothetical protein
MFYSEIIKKMISVKTIFLFYKPMIIVNDDSRVGNMLEVSLTDDSRVFIYDCPMFIVQATFHELVRMKFLPLLVMTSRGNYKILANPTLLLFRLQISKCQTREPFLKEKVQYR